MVQAFKDFQDKCLKAVEHFKRDLSKLRSGRATPSLLDGVMVDYYGTKTPLNKLGMVSAPEPRQLSIQVYDQGAIESIEKAIMQSELGLNPSRDGQIIRINIPALTEERRKEWVKKAKAMAEDNRVSLRNSRREVIDGLKKSEKDGKIAQDESRRSQEEVQKICDKYIKEIDRLLATKEKEIMDV